MKKITVPLGVLVVLALMVALPLLFWFGCRIEPENGQIAVLIKKTGNNLPPEQIIATDPVLQRRSAGSTG